MNYFQISCNFIKIAKTSNKKALLYFKENYNLKPTKCCEIKQDFHEDDEIYYVCQSCRKILDAKYDSKLTSIWLLLDQDDHFAWPDHTGETYYLQDCYRDKDHPEIHQAVRSILNKMHVNIVDIKENRENSIFCGNIHYETDNQDILDEIAKYPDTKLSHLPEELQVRMMKDYCKRFTDYDVITYCNRCTMCIHKGGVKATHLLDFIFQN